MRLFRVGLGHVKTSLLNGSYPTAIVVLFVACGSHAIYLQVMQILHRLLIWLSMMIFFQVTKHVENPQVLPHILRMVIELGWEG
jgi:hypothetical protein